VTSVVFEEIVSDGKFDRCRKKNTMVIHYGVDVNQAEKEHPLETDSDPTTGGEEIHDGAESTTSIQIVYRQQNWSVSQ
jgi:hypothetical protein